MVGQKRKQLKVYRPKNQILNSEEILVRQTSNLAPAIGGLNNSVGCSLPIALPVGDVCLSESYKKQKKDSDNLPSGSADQAEVATGQPRHTL